MSYVTVGSTPIDLPTHATLSLQNRVRRSGEFVTINARWRSPAGQGGMYLRNHSTDFGRWTHTDRDSYLAAREAAHAALQTARLDLLTRQHTAFLSFAELLDAPYSPTLRVSRLARAYDAAQAARGSGKRSFR